MIELEVGQSWPYPFSGEGMQAILDPAETGLSAMLLAAIANPTPAEIAALRERDLRLTVMPSPPLVWLALDAGTISLDAPYGVGLGGSVRARVLKTGAALADGWAATRRGLVTIAIVDAITKRIEGLRTISLSRAWWQALARAFEVCPDQLSFRERDAAAARDQDRWTTPDIIERATASEIGGRV